MPKRNYSRDERGRFAASSSANNLRNKAKMATTKANAVFRASHQGANMGSRSESKSRDKANVFWSIAEGYKTTGKRGRGKTVQPTIRYGTGVGSKMFRL